MFLAEFQIRIRWDQAILFRIRFQRRVVFRFGFGLDIISGSNESDPDSTFPIKYISIEFVFKSKNCIDVAFPMYVKLPLLFAVFLHI